MRKSHGVKWENKTYKAKKVYRDKMSQNKPLNEVVEIKEASSFINNLLS